jgi:hypothetical protein
LAATARSIGAAHVEREVEVDEQVEDRQHLLGRKKVPSFEGQVSERETRQCSLS